MNGGRALDRAGVTRPRAVAADLSGFVAMYEQGYTRLVAQLTTVTGSVSEAEDVVQEAFVRAAQRWDSLAGYDAPEAWVRRVAINLALSSLRRARRAAKTVAVWGRELDPGEANGPEAHGLERLALIAALRRLPVKYRVVLALHYLVDLDVRGIADELSIPEPTVKTRLARGRARLKDLIETAETSPETTSDADQGGVARRPRGGRATRGISA